ncbi:amidohydrolase family protein [Henriciella sp.]|uniref:N-acyl-D-amino-acid deacylase family protein n=1 Tax=Henriciella sp. TaxID=1968823 RepID=UPI00260F4C16|nr:amidohydrolase family protein [Henriciella sp.]
MKIYRTSLKRKLYTTGLSLTLISLAGCAAAEPAEPQTVDLLIENGTLFDGSNTAGSTADVAISGDRIVFVGQASEQQFVATRSIDAEGLVVVPGFIDPHTHYYEDLASDEAGTRQIAPALLQGVTTVFVGNDGGGRPDIAASIEEAETAGIGPNMASFVGFGAVRQQVLGYSDRAPDADELDTMKTLVADGMCEGAFGLSSGLFYAPQSYAETEEVIALAREASDRGGVYDTHIRDESSYTIGLLGGVEEVLEVARTAELPAHIAHIKALGVDVHGQSKDVISLIENAHDEGLVVTADQYPWTASGTSVSSSLLPRWAQVGGEEAMLARLTDADDAPKIREAMRENMRRRGGPDSLLLSSNTREEWIGKTIADLSAEWEMDPVDAAVRILKAGGSRLASFNQSDEDVERFMQQPWVVTSSDASNGHPRKYASFANKYATYVQEKETISMPEFVHRSSGLTAETFGVQERGYIKPGYYADIAIFDPDTFAPRATYVAPEQPSVGVSYVFVNGTLVVDSGQLTSSLAGRGLKHTPAPGTCGDTPA